MSCVKPAKVLNNRQIVEVDFWRNLYNQQFDYSKYRKGDVYKYHFLFGELLKEKGKGLDYGCGLVSMLEGHKDNFDSCDPLIDEYRTITDLDKRYLDKPKGKYDWIWCVNVIDHDNNWQEIINDFRKHLKKGGKLYFEVNFDDNISPAHAKLWRIEDIREAFSDFRLIKEDVYRFNEANQSIYQGIYEI
jgi:SAM-dependent methyltransferase